MNCWHCKTELVWGGDFTFEEYGLEGEGIVSNLSCQSCPAYVEVYYDIDKEKDYKQLLKAYFFVSGGKLGRIFPSPSREG